MKSGKSVVVAVSGGFDPIHPGHIRLFKEAKALGDKLIVILNNDLWLQKKKRFNFMSEKERKEVIEAIKYVDEVIISRHNNPSTPEEMGVSKELALIHPDIFANGGDRDKKNSTDPKSSLYWDIKTCKKLGINMIFNVGKNGKIRSSSELLEKYA